MNCHEPQPIDRFFVCARVGFFAIPPVGANVWVEFEGEDADYPIWSGCFWGAGEVPALPAVAKVKVFKTEGIARASR